MASDQAAYQQRDHSTPTTGITIPVGWFVGIACAMLTTVASAAWYMSDQAAEIRALKTLVVKEEAEAGAARKAFDESMNGLRLALNSVGDRTTRMESQLIYITDKLRDGSGKK